MNNDYDPETKYDPETEYDPAEYDPAEYDPETEYDPEAKIDPKLIPYNIANAIEEHLEHSRSME